MVFLPTVSSFFSTRGCFLWGGRSPSGDLPPLSSLWMASWCEWLSPSWWRRLQAFRVKDPSGARKGGPNRPPGWLGRLAQFGRPFVPVGPHVIMHFAPSTCMILTMSSSRPRWRFSWHEDRSFTLQSPGVFLVALRSLPPLEVISSSSWTRTRLCKCSIELVVNPSFMSMFSYINTILPNPCT
jgi:hypothetical protein